MQVSSAILIRVSLFNRFIIEKALFHISNMGSTSSAKILLSGAIARLPPWLWAWLPFNYFKNASIEFPWYLPYVFLLRKTLSEWILLATSKGTVVCHCYAEKIPFFPVRIEFSVFL